VFNLLVQEKEHTLEAEIIIKDNETGKILVKKKAESFIQHLINMLYVNGSNTTLATQTDTSGASVNMTTTSGTSVAIFLGALAAAAVDTYGIVVGTGNTAVTLTDTKLQTKISHGIGAGQLSYGAHGFVAATLSGNEYFFEINRLFSNSSGATITINEVGIYVRDGTSVAAKIFDVERSLATANVLNGGSVTVTYHIKVIV